MNNKEEKFEQLQRFYALWREENAVYDDWAREQGLSSNSALILYTLYEEKENCTQKSISQMWSIPKQTVNTILKEFSANGYIELSADKKDKRNKLIMLTPKGNAYAGKIVESLRKRELFAIDQMGLENITRMNNDTELFISLFKRGGSLENE
nr:MarR family winged helix-turn-helix transcriptional regulator [uncultured Anaerobutyricum sp.]